VLPLFCYLSKKVFKGTDWNIVLENNVTQKEGETHYNLCSQFCLVMMVLMMVRIELGDKSVALRQKLNYYVVYGSYLTPHHHHILYQKIN
jgi:hypothetical protein